MAIVSQLLNHVIVTVLMRDEECGFQLTPVGVLAFGVEQVRVLLEVVEVYGSIESHNYHLRSLRTSNICEILIWCFGVYNVSLFYGAERFLRVKLVSGIQLLYTVSMMDYRSDSGWVSVQCMSPSRLIVLLWALTKPVWEDQRARIFHPGHTRLALWDL